MENFVGLDLGKHAIRAASISMQGGKSKLLDVSTVEITKNAGSAIQNVFENKKYDKAEIWAGIDNDSCVIRDMVIPYTKNEQIKQTINFSCEEVIHDEVGNYLVDYQVIEKREEETSLMIIAGRKSAIQEQLDIYHGSHVDLNGLTCSKLGLYNLAAKIFTNQNKETQNVIVEAPDSDDNNLNDNDEDNYVIIDDKENVVIVPDKNDFLILDIGLTTADVIVGNSSTLKFFRGISTRFDIDADEVFEKSKLDRLFKEIKRSLFSGSVHEKFGKIYVCGGISTVNEICLQVENIFDSPTEIMPVEDAFDLCEAKGPLAAHAEAVGLALMASRQAPLSINFRREEFMRTPLMLQIKAPLIVAMIVLLLWFSWEGYVRHETQRTLIRSNRDKEKWQISNFFDLVATPEQRDAVTQEDSKTGQRKYTYDALVKMDIIPRHQERARPKWMLSEIERRIEDIGAIKEKAPVMKVLKAFLPVMEWKKSEDFRLKNINIDSNSLTIHGSFSTQDTILQFSNQAKKKLESDEKFYGLRIPTPTTGKDGRFYFKIEVNFKYDEWENEKLSN